MPAQRVNNFPLPEGTTELSLNQLQSLLKDEEYLTHYVINKAYNELNEIETLDLELEKLKVLNEQFDDLINRKLKDHMEDVDDKIEQMSTKLLDIGEYKQMLKEDFNSGTIKQVLDLYLQKVKKIELDPLIKAIETNPFDNTVQEKYIEKLTKWKKMNVLFDSLV